MTKDKDYEKTYTVSFNGDDKNWRAYRLKTRATGMKKKWWKVIQKAGSTSESAEDKELRDAAGYYFAMTCEKTAGDYVKANQSDPYLIWKAFLRRFDDLDMNDLTTLYTNFTELITDGPGLQDPTLWFYAIDEAQKDIVKAGGKEKDDLELLSLVVTQMNTNEHYREITSTLKTQKNSKLES